MKYAKIFRILTLCLVPVFLLNAYVWFETITGQSCIGNTFRPSYELSEDLIEVLQQAAHQAVADMHADSTG